MNPPQNSDRGVNVAQTRQATTLRRCRIIDPRINSASRLQEFGDLPGFFARQVGTKPHVVRDRRQKS
jgi:hypothetical protein